MNAKETVVWRLSVATMVFAAITVMYWLAADPPNPWILAVTSAGELFAIGTTVYKYRAGHFG